jgi:RNA polymerase sigma-70 factor (ECF subfamily)
VGDRAPIAAPAAAEEVALVEALRRGDEQAFASLIDRYHSSLLRLAMSYVATREAAEDVVQETWMGVLNGIDRFEARSSLKTWIFRILVNRAKTKGVRERRSVPFSSLDGDGDGDEHQPSVDPSRFQEGSRSAGAWSAPPESWEGIPEQRLLSGETAAIVDEAIASLPERQRAVITLRDIRGFTAQEACEVLGLTEANQRVLLHRARSKVRAHLEEYLGSAEAADAGSQAGK